MKKLLGILVIGFYRILDAALDIFGIKQEMLGYEQRKRR